MPVSTLNCQILSNYELYAVLSATSSESLHFTRNNNREKTRHLCNGVTDPQNLER